MTRVTMLGNHGVVRGCDIGPGGNMAHLPECTLQSCNTEDLQDLKAKRI